jgi:hypothetical protein
MFIFTFMKTSITTSLLAIFAFAVSTTVNAQGVTVDHYTSGKYECAIFPDTYPTDIGGKPFTPTHDQADAAIKTLEANLKKVKCDKKDDRDEIVKNLLKYKFQIFGYTDKSGSQMILINCFRNDDNKDKDLATNWLTEMIQVEDGGIYFWTIRYDVGKNDLFDFKTNGNG